MESEQGRGTTFRVLLPVADAAAVPAVQAVRTDLRRVLVVDDAAAVRGLTARMLLPEGREVLMASTIAEARAILDDPTVHLDALLTDIVLGPEWGIDLVAAARAARPQMRIVVMSGYAPEPYSSEVVVANGAQFLSKPFGRDQLLHALHGG